MTEIFKSEYIKKRIEENQRLQRLVTSSNPFTNNVSKGVTATAEDVNSE